MLLRYSAAVFVLCFACAPQKKADDAVRGTGETVSAEIAAGGGTLELEGTTLIVPAGAVPAGTVLSVTSSTEAPPLGVDAKTPVFRFEPDGIVFNTPVEVRFPYDGPTDSVVVYWSNADGNFTPMIARFEDGFAIVKVTHFSFGFVGTLPQTTGTLGFYTSPTNAQTAIIVRPRTIASVAVLDKVPVLGSVPVAAGALSVTSDHEDVVSAAVFSFGGYGAVTFEAKTAGVATLTATVGSRTATVTVTVSDDGETQYAPTPSSLSLVAGATGTITYPAILDTFRQYSECTCSAASATVASASLSGSTCTVTAAASGDTDVSLTCSSGGAVRGRLVTHVTVTNPAPVLSSISVTMTTVQAPHTVQMHATGHYSDDTSVDLTDLATWSSSNTGVATVDADTGIATGIAAGSSTITAAYGGKEGSVQLTVTAADVFTLAVTCHPRGSTQGALYCLPAGVGYSVRCKAERTSAGSGTTNITSDPGTMWEASEPGAVAFGEVVQESGADYIDVGIVDAANDIVISASSGGVSSQMTGTIEADSWVLSSQLLAVQSVTIGPGGPVVALAGASSPIALVANVTFACGPVRDMSDLAFWYSSDNNVLPNFTNGHGAALGEGVAFITAFFTDAASESHESNSLLVTSGMTGLSLSSSALVLAPGSSYAWSASAEFSQVPPVELTIFTAFASDDVAFTPFAEMPFRFHSPSAPNADAVITATLGAFAATGLMTTTAEPLQGALQMTLSPGCYAPGFPVNITAVGQFDPDATGPLDPIEQDLSYDATWTTSPEGYLTPTDPWGNFAVAGITGPTTVTVMAAFGVTGSITVDVTTGCQ